MNVHHRSLSIDPRISYVTDAGLETELIFDKGYHLAEFAAFPLLDTEPGRRDLKEYYEQYIAIAKRYNTGLILETPTWRANIDWGTILGYDPAALDQVNRSAVRLLAALRGDADLDKPFVISGCIGPRYDGYAPEHYMTADEAEDYHCAQIMTFSDTEADMVTALTMTSISEASGITLAAKRHSVPVVISFTTETDGRLPSGERLKDAINQIDQQTNSYPIYYMINCAHPTHFDTALRYEQAWVDRIHGVRANASYKSHAELNESMELDAGDPKELGQQYSQLSSHLHNLRVVGGCCGTSHRHVAAMAEACFR